MRAQSESAANRCETAQEKVCKCRCGGALHGAKRGRVRDLPFDDPHSPARPCTRCRGKGKVLFIDHGESVTLTCDRCDGQGKLLPKEAT